MRRFWLWLPSFVLDPLDAFERAGLPVDIPSYGFYSAFGTGVMIAAVLTYHELRMQASGLKNRLRPKLNVEVDEPRLSPDGNRKFVRLRVQNESHEQIVDCQGKLLSVKPVPPTAVPAWRIPEPSQNLCWTTRGAQRSGESEVVRSIPPKGHDFLDLAFADQRAFRLHFVFRDWQSWFLMNGTYELDVQISAMNVGSPALHSYKLCYGGGLDLTLDQT